MLQEVVMPQLQIKSNFDELFFQQNGAPPHYALRVRDITSMKSFHSVGSEEQVALNGHHARLTPMDFFFWGVVKNKLYEKNPKTVKELKDYILDAFREIDKDQNLCRTLCHSVSDRCE